MKAAAEMLNAGKTPEQIISKLDIHPNTLESYLRELGINAKQVKVGERYENEKRRRYAEAEKTLREVLKQKFGITSHALDRHLADAMKDAAHPARLRTEPKMTISGGSVRLDSTSMPTASDVAALLDAAAKKGLVADLSSTALCGLTLLGLGGLPVNLSGSILFKSTFTDLKLENASLISIHIFGSSLPAAQLRGASAINLTVEFSSMPKACLSGSDMLKCRFTHVEAAGIEMTGSTLSFFEFDHVNAPTGKFQKTIMDRVTMEHSDFDGSDLSGVNMKHSKMHHSSFVDAVISNMIVDTETEGSKSSLTGSLSTVSGSGSNYDPAFDSKSNWTR
jgi:uncharacterized protein YjbI with pentapeptide repeats